MLEQSRSGDANAEVSAVLASTPETAEEAKYEAPKTKRLGIGGWLAIAWLVFIFAFAFIFPLFTKAPAADAALANKGFLKDLAHPFGGDDIGNDLTYQLAEGTRNSLLVGFGAIAIGITIGGALGLIAGYLRGRTDAVLTMFFNIFLAIPQLVLALALVAVLAADPKEGAPSSFTPRLIVLIVALGLVAIPILGRITRANALQWSQREFVMAARAQGANSFRVMMREVLPNVVPAMFSIALLSIAVAIVAEGALSILGAGVHQGASLGNIIASGYQSLRDAPHVVFEPIVLIFFTVLSLNYLGDVVRARFDVRESVL